MAETSHTSGGRQGHPPYLRGKEIGLYYKNKNKNKTEKQLERATDKQFHLQPHVHKHIENMLESIKMPNALRSRLIATEALESDSLEAQYTHIGDSQFKTKFLEIVSGNIQEIVAKAVLMVSRLKRSTTLDEQLLEEHNKRQQSTEYQRMLEFRKKLPSYSMRQVIADHVRNHQVMVISGDTGCGKTTQVAQIILDDAIERGDGSVTRIVCTQPKRISAISVAERVAAERAESLGNSVGYQIRLEKTLSRDRGSIMYCTTGVLLQYMRSDPAVLDFSHIILDEIHERNTESDFIITLLKQIILKRPNLKVILMSATLNARSFSEYYNGCTHVRIPGSTYTVSSYYLETILNITGFTFPLKGRKTYKRHDDFYARIIPAIQEMEKKRLYNVRVTSALRNPMSEELSLELVEVVLMHICQNKPPGAILVFLPGIMDITTLIRKLSESGKFPTSRYIIYPLHSKMPTVDQKIILDVPPTGMRKIIISTSIAETSITIEDVVYVIDCGKTKMKRFDIVKNTVTLEPEWISLANVKQRLGRAGRVQHGECYHLYTKPRESTFEEYPLPEILRSSLEEVILQAKILQLGKVQYFLASMMDPPKPEAVELSLELLRNLNALDANENLTPLGYHLAKLPLDPRTGKMIIWASLFSCIEPVFAIAASLTFNDAFYCPVGKEQEAHQKKLELGLGEHSDHIALAEALRRFESISPNHRRRNFCNEYFLSWNKLAVLSDMKRQFASLLCEMKFLDSSDPTDWRANRNSNNRAVVKAVVCAGLYPNVALVIREWNHKQSIYTPQKMDSLMIHPGSVNFKADDLPFEYLTYFFKQRSTAVFLHDTTSINSAALLFAATKCSIKPQHARLHKIVLFDTVTFRCLPKTGALLQRLRHDLETLIEYKITHPGSIRWDSAEGILIRAITKFVSPEGVLWSPGRFRRRSSFE